jgi:hypothetical protein
MKKRAISIDPSRAVSGEKDVERVVDEAQLSPLPAAMGPGGVLHMEPEVTIAEPSAKAGERAARTRKAP